MVGKGRPVPIGTTVVGPVGNGGRGGLLGPVEDAIISIGPRGHVGVFFFFFLRFATYGQ